MSSFETTSTGQPIVWILHTECWTDCDADVLLHYSFDDAVVTMRKQAELSEITQTNAEVWDDDRIVGTTESGRHVEWNITHQTVSKDH